MLRSQHKANCRMPLPTHSSILTSYWETNSTLQWILHFYQGDVWENKTTLEKRHWLGIRTDYLVFPATSLQTKEPKGKLLVFKKRMCKAGVAQCTPSTASLNHNTGNTGWTETKSEGFRQVHRTCWVTHEAWDMNGRKGLGVIDWKASTTSGPAKATKMK